jgi:multidrug efflux pump subunit AcrB
MRQLQTQIIEEEKTIMGKFIKKTPQAELIRQYAEIVRQMRDLKAQKEKLDDVIFTITKDRGGMEAEGFKFSIASKPKYQYPEALAAEIRDVEERQEFIKIKMKRAVEEGKATIIDKGEYLVARTLKD